MPCREREKMTGTRRLTSRSLDRRGLLQDYMRIGATQAERAEATNTLCASRRPTRQLSRDDEGPIVQMNVRINFTHVQVGREWFVPERQDHLDKAGCSSRRLGVSDIRFHGPKENWLPIVPLPE